MPDETWSWPDTMDATVAAPESHRVLYEDDRTRVLEVVIPPGVRARAHPRPVENIDQVAYHAYRVELKG